MAQCRRWLTAQFRSPGCGVATRSPASGGIPPEQEIPQRVASCRTGFTPPADGPAMTCHEQPGPRRPDKLLPRSSKMVSPLTTRCWIPACRASGFRVVVLAAQRWKSGNDLDGGFTGCCTTASHVGRHRLTGTVTDAEDIILEAWLWDSQDTDHDPRAWPDHRGWVHGQVEGRRRRREFLPARQ